MLSVTVLVFLLSVLPLPEHEAQNLPSVGGESLGQRHQPSRNHVCLRGLQRRRQRTEQRVVRVRYPGGHLVAHLGALHWTNSRASWFSFVRHREVRRSAENVRRGEVGGAPPVPSAQVQLTQLMGLGYGDADFLGTSVKVAPRLDGLWLSGWRAMQS